MTEPGAGVSSRALEGAPIGVRVLRTGARAELPGRGVAHVLTIGAGRTCDLQIGDDPYVSAQHCYLELEGGRFVVHDCGSKNGTRVNHGLIRSRSSCEVAVGSLITIGRTTLIVYPQGAPDLEGPGLATFVRDAVRDYGSIRRAAQAIGVPRSTLTRWQNQGRGKARR